MAFNERTGTSAAALATAASLKRRALGKAVIEAAISWVHYVKVCPNQSNPMPQIRLCEAVEALNVFVKYG